MSRPKHLTAEEKKALMAKVLSTPELARMPDEFYHPRPQVYYAHNDGSWQRMNLEEEPRRATATTSSSSAKFTQLSSFRLITWNIDFLVPFEEPRMAAALSHLEELILKDSRSQPTVIMLQEMCPSDLEQIQSARWVQDRFFLTDLGNERWLSPVYGTTTLVDRRLTIKQVFRVRVISKFERDGLFVDVALKDHDKVLRLCNVHLESLVADPPVRPLQLGAIAKWLQKEDVCAAALAGDCNATQPFDRTLHVENGLQDAYLALGGEEDSEEGYTWGDQVPDWMKQKFGKSRMDKVIFCGALEAKSLQRIGVGVTVQDDAVREQMKDAGWLDWVTDHYGLVVDLELKEDRSLRA